MKSSEKRRFSHDFRGNRSYVIRLNLLNIRSKIRRRSLNYFNIILEMIKTDYYFLRNTAYKIIRESDFPCYLFSRRDKSYNEHYEEVTSHTDNFHKIPRKARMAESFFCGKVQYFRRAISSKKKLHYGCFP